MSRVVVQKTKERPIMITFLPITIRIKRCGET